MNLFFCCLEAHMHIMYQVTFHTTFTQALETAITECEKTSSLFKIHIKILRLNFRNS